MPDKIVLNTSELRVKKRTLSFQLDEDLIKVFDDYAKRNGVKKVKVIDTLLRRLLADELGSEAKAK